VVTRILLNICRWRTAWNAKRIYLSFRTTLFIKFSLPW